ncbi:MAG: sporulation membrane protein YtaF [Lachnospiraceae bacterium]|nr:sporulation membrane protein YtaF [Lachnospiraceae bacterium]
MPMQLLFLFSEALCLSLALSLDAFIAAFSYGTCKIKIPPLSVLVISGVCSLCVALSLAVGSLLKDFIPPQAADLICFLLLFLLGLFKLLDGIVKSLIQKHGAFSSNLHFSFCNLRFVLSLYANPECADVDNSKTISPKEALSLSIALSLDGFAAGLGAAFGNVNGIAVFTCSLLMEALAVLLGSFWGNRTAQHLSLPISWVGGLLLVIMAVLKLL